ncbi:hypothetical protein [Alkalicoccus luteus]|uniref:Uncharacterized protein n=1 Tax=Alkalicoccus luteus TaxID=1237094 RepID=A0A969TW81_9BACI|nr:hypothetical protein [Alkalicoccus luteus]NJP38796.1 hypothetical protein [Alkalicoccus luteus]
MWLYDLILVLIGFGLGIVSAGPLKNMFSGKWREDARQKKRVKLLSFLQQSSGKGYTAAELNQIVFKEKLNADDVDKLLSEIAESALIYNKSNRWYFADDVYRKHQKHYRGH